MALRDIRDNLTRDIREPVLHVCQKIVDRLASMRSTQVERLTYVILADFVKTKPDDHVFLSALNALTTIEHNALILYFVFYDKLDGREIAVSASEVMQSVDESVFIHPRTGEEIEDFTTQLKPVYRASEELKSALAVDDGR